MLWMIYVLYVLYVFGNNSFIIIFDDVQITNCQFKLKKMFMWKSLFSYSFVELVILVVLYYIDGHFSVLRVAGVSRVVSVRMAELQHTSVVWLGFFYTVRFDFCLRQSIVQNKKRYSIIYEYWYIIMILIMTIDLKFRSV